MEKDENERTIEQEKTETTEKAYKRNVFPLLSLLAPV
jgi:hypothetical protein